MRNANTNAASPILDRLSGLSVLFVFVFFFLLEIRNSRGMSSGRFLNNNIIFDWPDKYRFLVQFYS